MSEDKKPDREKSQPRPGFIPSHLSSEMKKISIDEIKAGLPDIEQDESLAKIEARRQRSPVGRVIKHAASILVATFIWGVIVSQVWPDISAVYEGADETMEEAMRSVYAMSPEETERLHRGMDAWMYLNTGALVIVFGGLTVAGCLIKQGRLKHVFGVAIAIWLVNGGQVLFGSATIESHALSVIRYAIFALLAVGLSYVFVRPRKNDAPVETQ